MIIYQRSMPFRMARPLRLEFAGALYHVTARGERREPIYEDDEDRSSFLDIFGTVIEDFNWVEHAYCLMGNHYHLRSRHQMPISPRACASSMALTLSGRIGVTGGSAIFFRDATRRFWWIRTRTCWSYVATSC